LTALVDGSLLSVGGVETPSFHLVDSPFSVLNREFGEIVPGSPATTLLPDGSVLIFSDGGVFRHAFDATDRLGYPGTLASPLIAHRQENGEILVIDSSPRAQLYDPPSNTFRDAGVAITARGRALGMPGGIVLVAGQDSIDFIRPSGTDGQFSVESLSVDLGCSRPALARLPNGRVLVVGETTVRQFDVRTRTLSAARETILPRCNAVVITRPDGQALLMGGSEGPDGTGVLSSAGELYEPATSTTARTEILLPPMVAPQMESTVIHWFDHPVVWWGYPYNGLAFQFDWDTNDPRLVLAPQTKPSRLLPNGWFLSVGQFSLATLWGRGRPAPPPLSQQATPPLTMNAELDFEQVFSNAAFPGNAPEGTSGTTTSSATNLPIPVWFPAEQGWPTMGTITKQGSRVLFRVPRTPFPGDGLLFLATNGALTAYGQWTIEPSANGSDCRHGGECESGHCVDDVCCDSACNGTCEACSAATKEEGDDGVCGFARAETDDDGCTAMPRSECGQNGTCDGRGQCASYPEGSPCIQGAECRGGVCTVIEKPPTPMGDAGTGGSGPEMPADNGGEGGSPPATVDECKGDVLYRKNGDEIECPPYRCINAQCMKPCTSSRDCVGGNICTAGGRCEPARSVTRTSGCGCQLPGTGEGSGRFGLALLVLGAMVGRRRARTLEARLTDPARPRCDPN
jgi:hypothetical protein